MEEEEVKEKKKKKKLVEGEYCRRDILVQVSENKIKEKWEGAAEIPWKSGERNVNKEKAKESVENKEPLKKG